MSRSFRHVWPDPIKGTHWLNLDLPGVVVTTIVLRKLPRSIDGRDFVQWTHDQVVSAVAVTACEWNPTAIDAGSDLPEGGLHRGDAVITVSNVRPYVREPGGVGGVEFVVTVDHPSPLLIATTVTVFDELPTMSR
jgi:hypothetical protein